MRKEESGKKKEYVRMRKRKKGREDNIVQKGRICRA